MVNTLLFHYIYFLSVKVPTVNIDNYFPDLSHQLLTHKSQGYIDVRLLIVAIKYYIMIRSNNIFCTPRMRS